MDNKVLILDKYDWLLSEDGPGEAPDANGDGYGFGNGNVGNYALGVPDTRSAWDGWGCGCGCCGFGDGTGHGDGL